VPRYALLILAFASLLWVALAFASPGQSTIGVDAIKPGMKGYGLTVFRGMQPERFDVEVIDVLHDFRPDQDLILIRTPHPILNRAKTVGGMSGSPIYLDGKLAGAYAYGWQFGSEPIAGVTPIASMLAELWRPLDPAIFRALGTLPGGPSGGVLPGVAKQPGASGTLGSADPRRTELRHRIAPRRMPGTAPYLGEPEGAFDALRAHADRQAGGWQSAQAGRGLLPAATPLMLGGMDEQVVELLSTELERFGIFGVQAGGSGGKAAQTAPVSSAGYVDGGAIAVDLVRGDINMTGIGTVTHVEGQRLVGFGHPMMLAGQTALPTSTARVLHILASEMRSFKIAERQQPLGTLVHDRQAAIVVDAGLTADTVPVRVRVTGPKGVKLQAPKAEWNMEVVGQRLLTPSLSFAAVLNALRATAPEQSDVTFTARSRVRIEGHGVVEVTDEGYTGLGIAHPLALSQIRLFQLIGAAYGNPFQDVRVESVEVDLEVVFENRLLTLVDAQVASREVDPGSSVDVYLTLRAFNGDEQVRVLPVYVPPSAAGEKLDVELAPGYMVHPEQPKPTSLKQILEAVRMSYASDSLIVSTKLPNQGLRMRGHVVRSLPGSMLDTLQMQSAADKPLPFVTYDRKAVPMGQIVLGQAKIQLDVRREPRK
jgi:hypothetical protein